MSRAIYHRGLTIESDPKKPVLSIEGQDIPIQKTDGQYQSKDYPELRAYLPYNVAVPVQPILLQGHEEGELITLADLRKNHRSLLDTFVYENEISLINNLERRIIEPAEELFKQLNG